MLEYPFNASVFALTLFAFAFAFAVAPNVSAKTPGVHLPDSDRPIEETHAFEVNIDNTSRLIVRSAERHGILALAELARRSDLEEAWVFLPDEEVWVEIGQDECLMDHRSAVAIDVSYLEKLLAARHTVRLYHFHPERFCVPRSDSGETLTSQSFAEQVTWEDVRRIGLSLPSPADIGLSITLSMLALEFKDSREVEFAVVTPLGIASYGPTREGLLHLQRMKDYPFGNGPSEMIIEAVAPLGPTNIRATIQALKEPTLAEVISNLTIQSSGYHFRVAFNPISDWR